MCIILCVLCAMCMWVWVCGGVSMCMCAHMLKPEATQSMHRGGHVLGWVGWLHCFRLRIMYT